MGAAIAFAFTPTLSVETEIGYRHGEIDALSSTVSLLYNLPRLGRVTPYFAGGVGLNGTERQSNNRVWVSLRNQEWRLRSTRAAA